MLKTKNYIRKGDRRKKQRKTKEYKEETKNNIKKDRKRK